MKKLLKFLDENLEKYLSIGLFGMMIFLCVLQVVFRYLINTSLAWTEELARYCFIASIYFGASYGIKNDEHIRVEIFNSILPKKAAFCLRTIANVIWLLFSLYIVYIGVDMCQTFVMRGQTTPTLHLPTGYVYGIVPVGFALMSIRIAQKLWKDIHEWINQSTGEGEARS